MTRILIIDDDFEFADLTRRRIERLGFDVKLNVGARGAMDQLLHGGFALVVLDLKMPDIDGPAMIRMIRTLGTGQIKVMFYSSSDNSELRQLAQQHGADTYLNKSATTEELEFRLRQLLGPPRAERRANGSTSPRSIVSGIAPRWTPSGSPARARAPSTVVPPGSRRRD